MASFGERMRRERAKRGITLESISQATKIRPHILEALEKQEFDKLPGGIFNKSIVRSYASFLGMNEERALKEFIEVAGDPEQPLPDPPASRHSETPPLKPRRSWGRVATVIVCAVALLFGGWRLAHKLPRAAVTTSSSVDQTRSQPAMTSAEGVAANNSASSSSQASSESSSTPATDQPESLATATLQSASHTTTTPAPELVPATATTRTEKFVILVKAKRPTWVSITADGKPFLEGVLKRKKKIRAYSQVVLKTNNAGALAVAQNGRPLPPLGDENQQTTVTFSPDGVTQ